MTESCATCRFAIGDRDERVFFCHRHAPTVPNGIAEVFWPRVRWNDVCGEWAAPLFEQVPSPVEKKKA